ncbi:MAG: hypothetical protein R3A44_00075 [Caldilineaceae bacterium]
MLNKNKKTTFFSLGVVMAGLLALAITFATRPVWANGLPQSAYQQLQAVWQRAGDSPQYDYHSTILQTTTPAASLASAGRSPLNPARAH